MSFTVENIPDQAGKLAIITGATGGLGYETALALAGAGATVILTGRNSEKGAAALAGIRSIHPQADIVYDTLDLAHLSSVAAFTDRIAQQRKRIDILVNNAGVMATPKPQVTAEGFEMQFGTNYLGHFALTARLLPQLIAGKARVVSLSSIAARGARIDFDDLQATKRYTPFVSYGQSKLAMLMFAFELQRRSDAGGWGVTSIGAHPGISRTSLIANGPGQGGAMRLAVVKFFSGLAMNIMAQSAADGALPQIFAATALEARPGGYYGPADMGEYRGPVAAAKPPQSALDVAAAARLWAASEQLTHLPFPTDRKAA